MPEVRFRLLGPMEILVHQVPSKLPGAAERALLVQLLLAPGRTIPATMLVDRLWSESALPVDPMNALQIRVSKLRRALKAMGIEDLVTRDGVGYRADVDPSQVDALDFEYQIRTARAVAAEAAAGDGYHQGHLQAYDDALALWRGDPLSDFVTEQWATVEASRLTELRFAAITERAQVALALGRHLEVVADLETQVAREPTMESLAGLLMVALYRSGRQADALAVYTRTRDELDETLGLEPSVSLRSLHERVLRQDESLGAQPAMPATMPSPSIRSTGDGQPTAPTNLPTVVRPLIGRDTQLESLTGLLSEVRLLSLIGPGGAGKTSLALAVVAATSRDYPDGAFGVRLASVDSGDQVPLAVADALGVPLDGSAAVGDVRERLVSYLSKRRMLLLVDNCEHVVDTAAALIDNILSRSPHITVIATSREALAVPDEVQVTVGPLETPPESVAPSRVLDYPAAQLFAERARAVRPGLVFDSGDLQALGRISRALDGIPLALELAAARVGSMSPTEIATRLADRFTLLTSGTRTAEARQQTLRATVDWSYLLLSDVERTVFNRLSVFQGGWTLTSAEAVVGDAALPAGEVLDTIGRLVERSMIAAEPGPTTRYRMLETLRHYATEQLAASGEVEELAERHARYFRGVAEQAEIDLRGHGQRETLRLLREEQPNIRAAISWLSRPGGDIDSALVTAGSLGMFWHLGRHLEGREVLGRLVTDGAGSPAARARALQAVSIVERPRGCLVHPHPRCAEAAEESLAIFEDLGDSWHAALSKVLLAVEGVTGAHRERSETLLREAEEQFARDGDPWGPAVVGFVRLETAMKAGDVDAAVHTGRATAASFRQLDDPWGLSATLYHLGWGLRQFGRFEEGARVLEEAIDVGASAGLWNTVQWALADLAVEKVHIGELQAARDLLDRAAAASQEIGDGAGEVLAGYGYGLLAEAADDWASARRYYEEAVTRFERLGTLVMVGVALAGLGRCDEAQGEVDSAAAHYQDALALGRRLGEPSVTAAAIEGLSRLARDRQDVQEADRLLHEAREIRSRYHRPAPPHERREFLT
ncbi:AfsR/SARP family transcriptional regulator [Nocardioides bizhenqiangii]|uniref:BTAD domain-containing putative transcriptional regulator n=1 Tax=Nocardioides bizhenqiangii TaxID=3095076 RepID=A0ABZ0ZU70_9ACTN|nr:BTAD domain-containing putative transcriptional regulator [Nocardioides sp. HM61]WQQ27777.1 BTAD domain-containing putative transcriptional regulator [Nocardioides sp. HM61]